MGADAMILVFWMLSFKPAFSEIALISHASKVMLKILQAKLQQYMNNELPDVQAGFRKGRGTRNQIVNIHWIMQKTTEYQNNIYLCFIDYVKVFDCVNHNKLWKKKRWEYQTTLRISWETSIQVDKQRLEPYMEQLTGSKLGKEYDKAVNYHTVHLIYMHSEWVKAAQFSTVQLFSRV